MNTYWKKVKAEQDYILRDAVLATPEEYPQLCRIFEAMKKKNPYGRRLTLMVGESYSAGMAFRRSRSTGVILIDPREITLMNEQETRCLLGHELGHHFCWREIDNKKEVPKLHTHMPRPLSYLFSSISKEILADIVAVEQCRSAFVAGSYLSDGETEMQELYSNPLEPLPVKFYDDFELAIRIKALGILAKSEYFYEIIGSELFGYGKWVISTEEYFVKMDHLLDPYMNFTDEDGRALAAFLGASLFIAGCKIGDVSWRRDLDMLAGYGEPGELLAFASKDQAYDRILSVSDKVSSIRHPLKHIAWNTVWDVTYRDWEDSDEAEKFDNFIDYIDGRDSTAA